MDREVSQSTCANMKQKQQIKIFMEYLTFKNIVKWLCVLAGLPVTLPWLAHKIFDILWLKQRAKTLQNKVVMITGASSGLGEALAHVFYKSGCKLILIGRKEHELLRVKIDLTKTYQVVPLHMPIILSLDLCDTQNLQEKITNIILVHNKIDILINNAGISYRGDAINTDILVDTNVMKTNYFSQIHLAKIVLPFMISQNSGHIVGISSVQGRIAIPYRSAYAASKHAIQAWYDSIRAELCDTNIKFTIVNPGYIKTNLSMNALTASGQVYGLMDETTANGYEPEYVAQRILEAVLKQKEEVTIAPFSAKCGILIRTWFPFLYFKLMARRARKQLKSQ